MMLSATVQARRALEAGQTSLIDLEPHIGDWLDREFRAVLGPDVHYLVPPPEEAW
jgi:hypothetical protein